MFYVDAEPGDWVLKVGAWLVWSKVLAGNRSAHTQKDSKVSFHRRILLSKERPFIGLARNCLADEGFKRRIELKSLILAQIERWRHALHMQVER